MQLVLRAAGILVSVFVLLYDKQILRLQEKWE